MSTATLEFAPPATATVLRCPACGAPLVGQVCNLPLVGQVCNLPLVGQVCNLPLETTGRLQTCPTSGGFTCEVCGRDYPLDDGLLVARGELQGKNRIAAAFYESDRWQRFRFWEQLFLKCFGGLPGARMQILRHLRPASGGDLLEVGIGDGENVALLPLTWRISGVDIARRPLSACRDRHAGRGLFLALAEGERLPFADRSFDAVLCVGGFNFFSDPLCALKEMARVTRPRGRIVVADELPDLFRWGWGHLLGWPALDRWLMERFWLGPEFTAMVLANNLDVAALGRAALGRHRLHAIWRGLGWCLAGSPPDLPAAVSPTRQRGNPCCLE